MEMEKRSATHGVVAPTPSQPVEAEQPLDAATPSPAVRAHYVVVSVEQAPVPDGGHGTEWCRYVLSCGTSRITGLHPGTLSEVTAFAISCAEDFNRRSATGKGKAGVAYTRKTPLSPAAR
jgi:hypothetical protein